MNQKQIDALLNWMEAVAEGGGGEDLDILARRFKATFEDHATHAGELLPCPFCGGPPDWCRKSYIRKCQHCGAQVPGNNIQETEDKWNRRTADPLLDRMACEAKRLLTVVVATDDDVGACLDRMHAILAEYDKRKENTCSCMKISCPDCFPGRAE
jgi:hypothetical protein